VHDNLRNLGVDVLDVVNLRNMCGVDERATDSIPTLARVAAYGGGLPIKVDGELVGAIGVSGAPTVQNDIDCASAALALVSDAVLAD